MPNERQCSICLAVKKPDQFPKSGNACRECVKARARRYYAANTEKYRAKNRAYYARTSTRPRRQRPQGYRLVGQPEYLCIRCNLTKAVEEFSLQHGGRSVRSHCRECRAEEGRWDSVARRYGLSRAQYADLLASQGGTCAICKRAPGDQKFPVDHDHACCPGMVSCGRCVRGLLCGNCNRLLGSANDNPEVLRAAVTYLGRRSSGSSQPAYPTDSGWS